MKKKILKINSKIKSFSKKIRVEGDKSISIRWVLLASLSKKKSRAYNLLESEDVISAINCIKKLGSKITKKKNFYEIIGTGLNYNEKNNITLNAGNSGTLARLILGLLTNYQNKIKIVGDKSLSKRDFSRITEPLKKFGVKFNSKKNSLPLSIIGRKNLKPINYQENKGSAQCKSAVMLAGLKANGKTKIKAKASRNHTELMFKELNIPIKVKRKNTFDYIEVSGIKKLDPLNYNIPGDISSSSFFIVLTLLTKNSKLIIKNININPSRTGIITILKKMGASIKIFNKKTYKGEMVGDLMVKYTKNLKSINCPKNITQAQ